MLALILRYKLTDAVYIWTAFSLEILIIFFCSMPLLQFLHLYVTASPMLLTFAAAYFYLCVFCEIKRVNDISSKIYWESENVIIVESDSPKGIIKTRVIFLRDHRTGVIESVLLASPVDEFMRAENVRTIMRIFKGSRATAPT